MGVLDRLADKFVVADGCWEWTASRGGNGYGTFALGGTSKPAHRVLYELLVGPIADGHELDHLCRNRGCVRPDHLEMVTRSENLRRAPHRNRDTTHCLRGHPFDTSNTYVNPANGQRVCLACQKLRRPRYPDKRRGAHRRS